MKASHVLSLSFTLLSIYSPSAHAECQDQMISQKVGELEIRRAVECCAEEDVSSCYSVPIDDCIQISKKGKNYDRVGKIYDCSPIRQFIFQIEDLNHDGLGVEVGPHAFPFCVEQSPYSAGSSRSIFDQSWKYHGKPGLFEYRRLKNKTHTLSKAVVMDVVDIQGRLAMALNKPATFAVGDYTTEFARGSFNRVYLVHSKIPPHLESDQRVAWAKEHATQVAKLMFLPSEEAMKSQIMKDNFLKSLATDALNNFSTIYDRRYKKPLIRLAKSYMNPKDNSVITQEFLSGPSAYDLGNMIIEIKKNTANAEQALNSLRNNGFSTVEEAEKAIATLEAFYTTTHRDVIDSLKRMQIDPSQNNRTEESATVDAAQVGFDFNHGRNIIWFQGQFVIIDL